MLIYVPQLCGNQSVQWALWSSDLTWNTAIPNITECFQLTILQWIPSAFLFIGTLVSLPSLRRKSTYFSSKLSRFNIIKNVLSALIGFLAVLDLIAAIFEEANGRHVVPILFIQPVIDVFTMIVICCMTIYLYIKGFHTSALIWWFWFFNVICQLFIMISQSIYISIGSHSVYRAVTGILTFLLVFVQFILNSFSDLSALDHNNKYSKLNGERAPLLSSSDDNNDLVDSESIYPPSPELKASYPSRLTFTWITALLILAYRRALTIKDVWEILRKHSSKSIFKKFDSSWKSQMKNIATRNRARHKKNWSKVKSDAYLLLEEIRADNVPDEKNKKMPSLFRGILKVFGPYYIYVGVLKLISDLIAYLQPPLLSAFIAFIGDPKAYEWHGYMIGVGLFVTSLLRTMFTQHYMDGSYVAGMNVRTMAIGQIYRKALRLSGTSRKERTVGEIVNLMSVDSQVLQEAPAYLHMIWTAPISIIIALVYLWQELGASAIAGLVVMILLIPINGFVATKVKKFQFGQLKFKDQRIKMMTEILNGIKVLKLYAWESSFMKKISEIRRQEVTILRKSAYLNAFTAVTWFCAPFITALVTFAIYVLTGNVLTSQRAFVSLSLFNLMNASITALPAVIAFAVQFSVSLGRINRYLCDDELDPYMIEENPMAQDAIKIDKGSFSWTNDGDNVLKDINLSVPDRKLYAVVGNVGSGKSSLVSSIIGEIVRTSGRVIVKGKIAYVPQQAWCQNCSLQDNILFGKKMRQNKYEHVIEACALKPDLEVLDAGDQTEIGEKGINLSGGQKQRVSLARAVYQDADIYLLDDPLSAVDSHVGKHIFEKVISDDGVLCNKTRLLVTHAITYLPKVDCIIVMKDGRISEMGTYNELLSRNGPFAEFLKTYLEKEDEENSEDEDENNEDTDFKNQLRRTISVLSGDESDMSVPSENRRKSKGSTSGRRRQSSTSGHKRRNSMKEDIENLERQVKEKKKLITEETAETGNVKLSVFIAYAKAIKVFVLCITVVSYICYLAVSVGTNLWLSVWSDDTSAGNDTAMRDYYLGGYAGFGFSQGFFVFIQNFILAYGSYCASLALHKEILDNVMRLPMSFFDTTPIGRIVNRFGKDIDVVDIYIPMFLRIWFMVVAGVFATLIVVSIASPVFLAALIPLSICYFFAQRFYICTSRQLKRIDSIKRSPIYSHFQETLVGISSVRSYKRQQAFIDKSDRLVDDNQMVWYANLVSNRWMGVILEGIGAVVVLLAAVFATLSRGTLGAGLAGASITYSLNITAMLNYSVRMTSDLETYIVAVERVKEYVELSTEASRETNRPLDLQWPSEGRIQIDKYSVRYRPGLDLVLKDISADIRPGERVGIVGRTGAGKSSFTLALFRILEPAAGSIKIDGIDITTLGLDDLRGRLTIIPQDPVLFSGNLRMNLDPFDAHSDGEVWTALEQAHLKEYVSGLADGLDHQCSEGGDNLSVGQRQLVCLARALLRRTKVLVLDEATAAVDMETDDVIQNTIRKEFQGCTILTIAHRLNTIVDYDRIMVLDKGMLKEFAAPSELLRQPESIFYGMCRNAGLV